MSTLSNTSMTHIAEVLNAPMPRGRGDLAYRKPLRHLSKNKIDGKFHIVFVTYYPYAAIIKKAMALRRNGRYYITLIAACIREDAQIHQYFDAVYEIAHYAELRELLPYADPWAFNVMSQPLILPLMVMNCSSNHRIIVDVNDGLYFSDPDHCSSECRIEQEIFQKADELLHKMPTTVFEKMINAWNIDTPHQMVHSLPAPQFFCEHHSSNDDPIKLVLSGGLMPYHLACQRGYENHIIDNIINGLQKNEVHLTCYLNQNARNMYWHEHQRYMDFERENKYFRFRKGIPYHLLSKEISVFDYGVIYEDINTTCIRRDHICFNMATKFFSYLEAGLPILIHDQSYYMAELVRRHGIGIVYPQDDIGKLAEMLRTADYKKLKKRVLQFRNENTIDATIPHLERAYAVPEDVSGEYVFSHNEQRIAATDYHNAYG